MTQLDPIGEAIGYVDPESNEERHVPLEIRIPDEKDTFYNQTFEDLGLYTETPTLPFATLGTFRNTWNSGMVPFKYLS